MKFRTVILALSCCLSGPVVSHHLEVGPNVLSETVVGGDPVPMLPRVSVSDGPVAQTPTESVPPQTAKATPADGSQVITAQTQEATEPAVSPAAVLEGIVGFIGGLLGNEPAPDSEPSASTAADGTSSSATEPEGVQPPVAAAGPATPPEPNLSIEREAPGSPGQVGVNEALNQIEQAAPAVEPPLVVAAQPEQAGDSVTAKPSLTAERITDEPALGDKPAVKVDELPGDYRSQVTRLVLNHPEVAGQYNSLVLAGWRVKEVESRSAPKLSFTTTGKYPIADNVGQSRLRADNLDREYVDGTLQLTKPVFDAGKRELLEVSAGQRRVAERLKYLQTFEKQLSRLLSLVIELSRDRAEEQSVTSDLAFLDESIATVRRRYELGAGTLNDIRVLEIQRLDLERILESSQRRIQLKTEVLLTEYGYTDEDSSWVLDVMDPVASGVEVVDFVAADSLVNRISQTEQTALEMERQSVRAERFPEVSLTLNGVLYDLVNRPAGEYELYGGLSMSLPLFDGGERDARIEGIEAQKTIESTALRKLLADLQASWDETVSQIREIETQRESDEKRLESILDRLGELKIRARTIESGLLEVTQTELQRRSVARELVLGRLSESVLLTRRAELAGRLMELTGIEPNIQ